KALQPVARQVAVAKTARILRRAAQKPCAERFASRSRLRLRRPLPFQPRLQGQIRHLPGESPQGNLGQAQKKPWGMGVFVLVDFTDTITVLARLASGSF